MFEAKSRITPMLRVLLATLVLFATGCSGSNLIGTGHSVILRPSSERDRYYGAYALINAADWQNGRARATPLSRGDIDPKTGVIRFALPIPDGLSGAQAICLMIVGSGGPLPIHPGTSGPQQYIFRNQLWEVELQRMTAIKQSAEEVQRLAAEAKTARSAVTQAEYSLKSLAALAPEQCREGQPLPLPQRPIDAVIEVERGPVAASVCAAAWEELLGATAAAYYQLINRPEVWNSHDIQAVRQKRMNYHMGPSPKEIHALRIAPEEGERWMLYESTVARFRSLTGECESRVVQAFAEETARWEKKIQETEAAPRRALEQCRRLTSAYRDAQNNANVAEVRLRQEMAALEQLRSSRPKTIESESLSSSRCP